jgi:hypothetical protein
MSIRRLILNSELKTTEYSEHTEDKSGKKGVVFTKMMNRQITTTASFPVYSVYSVVHHLPFLPGK